MRVTIIPDDGFVSVDGEGYLCLDLSFLPADINAVQWYHNEGEVERRDAQGRPTCDEKITDLSPYAQALDLWHAAKAAAAKEIAAIEAEEIELIESMLKDKAFAEAELEALLEDIAAAEADAETGVDNKRLLEKLFRYKVRLEDELKASAISLAPYADADAATTQTPPSAG